MEGQISELAKIGLTFEIHSLYNETGDEMETLAQRYIRMVEEAKPQPKPVDTPDISVPIPFNDRIDYRCWVSPIGQVIEVRDHHFEAIKANPIAFGFDPKYVEKFSRRTDPEAETSRENLIFEAVRRGWMRIRFYSRKRPPHWSVNIGKFDTRRADRIESFFNRIYRGGKSYSEVIIDFPMAPNIHHSVQEIREFALYKDIQSTDLYQESLMRKRDGCEFPAWGSELIVEGQSWKWV